MSERLRGLALKLLARREHSRAELQRKLAAHGDSAEVSAALDQLESSGLLSDARFVESYVAARRERLGALRLRFDLRARGIADTLIEQALAGCAGDELARARALWQRKFDGAPGDAREYAKQARFLQSRGYSADILKQLLRESQEK